MVGSGDSGDRWWLVVSDGGCCWLVVVGGRWCQVVGSGDRCCQVVNSDDGWYQVVGSGVRCCQVVVSGCGYKYTPHADKISRKSLESTIKEKCEKETDISYTNQK